MKPEIVSVDAMRKRVIHLLNKREHWVLVADTMFPRIADALIGFENKFYDGDNGLGFEVALVMVAPLYPVTIALALKKHVPPDTMAEFMKSNFGQENFPPDGLKDLLFWCPTREIGYLMAEWFVRWIQAAKKTPGGRRNQ